MQQIQEADYLYIGTLVDRNLDPSQLPESLSSKIIYDIDEETVVYEKRTGFRTFINKIQHLSITEDVPPIRILTHLTLHQKVKLAKESFACPITTNLKSDKTKLYCYYQLPNENETKFLHPSKIPEKCNKIIIKGATIVNGTVEFLNGISKDSMIKFRQQLLFNHILIGSLKCEDNHLYAGPRVNESTLVANIIRYVDAYQLDGLEIDCELLWEIDSFNTFLNSLRTNLGSSKVLGIQLPSCQDTYHDERISVTIFWKYCHVSGHPFQKLNPKKILEVVSPLSAYHRSFKTPFTKDLKKLADLKKQEFPIQYDFALTRINDSIPFITETIFERNNVKYVEICRDSRILNCTIKFDIVKRCSICFNDEGKLFHDSEVISKYFYGKGQVAFDSLNDDDWENVCGNGEFPIFNNFWK